WRPSVPPWTASRGIFWNLSQTRKKKRRKHNVWSRYVEFGQHFAGPCGLGLSGLVFVPEDEGQGAQRLVPSGQPGLLRGVLVVPDPLRQPFGPGGRCVRLAGYGGRGGQGLRFSAGHNPAGQRGGPAGGPRPGAGERGARRERRLRRVRKRDAAMELGGLSL